MAVHPPCMLAHAVALPGSLWGCLAAWPTEAIQDSPASLPELQLIPVVDDHLVVHPLARRDAYLFLSFKMASFTQVAGQRSEA